MAELPACGRLLALHERQLERGKPAHALEQQTIAVDHEEAFRRLVLRQAGIDHRGADQAGDAAAGGAGAEHRDALFGERHAGDVDRGEQGAGRHRGGALDVVVEGQQPVAIALQHARRIVLGEILPLQQHARPALHHRRDECLDEVVIGLAADALVAPADIERIRQAIGIVGADVEQDRQRGRRMEAAAAGVERELADRDTHAAGALVAETEDAFAIGHHDRLDMVETRMSENAVDPVLVWDAEEQPAGLAKQAAEFLATLTDGWRVDDRQQLFEVADQERVEQRLVGVLQLAQKGIALDVRLVAAQRLEAARDLLVQRQDVGRQQAVQIERLALGFGERRALVQPGIGQQLVAAQRSGRESSRCLRHDKVP